jgi:hypothetical protein
MKWMMMLSALALFIIATSASSSVTPMGPTPTPADIDTLRVSLIGRLAQQGEAVNFPFDQSSLPFPSAHYVAGGLMR